VVIDREDFLNKFSIIYQVKKNLFIFNFVLIFLIATLHILAINFFLYWKFWWFDILLHFLGGLWVGLSFLQFYFFSNLIKIKKKSNLFIFIFSVLTVLFVGLGWEIFEFIIGVNFSENYWSDTILDLIMDTVGALTVSLLFIKLKISAFE